MNRYIEKLAIAAGLTLTLGSASTSLSAEDGAGPPPALRQCGECHMVFPAQMLPMRSWTLILSGLDDHFGVSASIPSGDLPSIRAYLTSHAADSPHASAQDRHYYSDLSPDSAPTRITQTPWWNQMHADFDFDGVKRGDVKSPADCLACHKDGVP